MTRPMHVLVLLRPAAAETEPQLAFESLLAAIGELHDCHCEPDGSFVWRGSGETSWQIDGQLHDGRGGLDSVELRGKCGVHQWNTLLTIFGNGVRDSRVQILPCGEIVALAEFRQVLLDDDA